MSLEVSKADWRVFREARELALERYCERVLSEVRELSDQENRSWHDRYLRVFEVVRERDKSLADAFNNPRRSQMLFQLAMMHSLNLVEERELALFTEGVRERVVALVEGLQG